MAVLYSFSESVISYQFWAVWTFDSCLNENRSGVSKNTTGSESSLSHLKSLDIWFLAPILNTRRL